MGKESAPLLLGLAWHAQRRTWEDQKTILADRVSAVFADSIAAVQNPLERVLALFGHLPGVVDQRDLLLALEGLGAGVCLVVARPVAGVKTFEREQEISLVNNAREVSEQSEHALERILDGSYGVCENCGNPIGKNRLLVFPRATLCVPCKSKQERR